MRVKQAGQFKVLDFPPVKLRWNFWAMWESGEWEPETHAVISEYAAGKDCVDIGAWVGPTVLWMHEAGAASIRAFEPDPVAHGVLRTNVLLNDLDVNCSLCAVGQSSGKLTLTAEDFGEARTQVQPEPCGHNEIEVYALSVDSACIDAEFVKVDIEGAELDLLPDLATVGCPMLISTHAPWWPADREPDWSGWSSVEWVVGDGSRDSFGEVLCLP